MKSNTPPVLVPLAHATELASHTGGVHQSSSFVRKYALQHPEWRLDEDDEADWSRCCGLVLDASFSALPNIAPIAAATPTFTSLTILCLRESGVVDIQLLRSCSNLVHLDLSSNEIVHLADDDFWASFQDMLVLLLHGNKVSEWRAVGGLGKAPKLTYLTLFFNPVCKRKMYRQFTTNCCQNLRGLDLHAVSDEEVVEGYNFYEGSRCKSCSSSLALPQPLFKGLTEVPFAWNQERHESTQEHGVKPCCQLSRSATEARVKESGRRPRCAPNCDARVLAIVLRRVQLLRNFHARLSPVIIGQRQIRRFLVKRLSYGAAVKIQARARAWIVKLRSTADLKDILRESGELFLVQEMMTPVQVRSLVWFQRRIAGHLRMKMLIACAKTLERFIGNVEKKFCAFVENLERSQVRGVVVGYDKSGELAGAVAKALAMTRPRLTRKEVDEQAETLITVVSNCRRLRPSSYIKVPDWPIFEKDVDTDAIYVTRSNVSIISCAKPTGFGSIMTGLMDSSPSRPLSGLQEPQPTSHMRYPRGLFGCPRLRQCRVSRRRVCARIIHRSTTKNCGTLIARRDEHEKLWIFRSLEARTLARVLRTLRYESSRKSAVPFILEHHLMRCASATRIQAAWRGHVLRWFMLDPLASCVVVARAGVCIQRWWRYRRGLATRLRLCRRLWSLASAVSSPTLYVEQDVFFTLTRRWRGENDESRLLFTFQDGEKVVVVRECGKVPSRTPDSRPETGKGEKNDMSRERGTPARELPMWITPSVVRQVSPSEVNDWSSLNDIGALLTAGVNAKRVVWPLEPPATSSIDPAEESSARDNAGSRSTDILLSSAESEGEDAQEPLFNPQHQHDRGEHDPPIDLGEKYGGGVELLELTFPSVREARARAVLLAFTTEESGVWPNRPVAQLMTLGMLRRAAAGEPGRAVPILKAPAQGFRRGDAVEVSMLRLSDGHGGAWIPATVDGQVGHGNTYNVILEDGTVKRHVPENGIHPLDRTGKESALVEMSHLPSRWRRPARSLFTPADRLDFELLRQSLPSTAPIKLSPGGCPIRLLSSYLGPEADASVSIPDGLEGRRLLPVTPRPLSLNSPLGRPGVETKNFSPSRWASSRTKSAAKGVGEMAIKELEEATRAAVAADKASGSSTWVPGNKFRVGLEKLVHLNAHKARDAADENDLRSRRENAARVRHEEHTQPSPRDRLEKLKTAEVAIFRHESQEMKDRAALERAIDDYELRANAAEARECARDGRRLATEAIEANRANCMADIKRRELEVESDRLRSSEKRHADVYAAKARVVQMRQLRTKQASRLAESNRFSSNISQLTRHVDKHTTMLTKVQNTRGMQRWVRGQKAHKEEMRRRMLDRVKLLQAQKRSERTRLRRVLAARGRARVAMDEAVIRHRFGEALPCVDDLTEDVIHVLKPRSRLQAVNGSAQEVDYDPFAEDSGAHGWARENASAVPQAPQEFNETGHVTVQRRHTSDGASRQEFPSKPEVPRQRSREQKNRCLYSSEAGKTVVVHASVPTVARETRSSGRHPHRASAVALLGYAGSQSTVSPARDDREAPKVWTDKTRRPWPLGRRLW